MSKNSYWPGLNSADVPINCHCVTKAVTGPDGVSKSRQYLNTSKAAAFLGVSSLLMRQWRSAGKGPAAVKVSGVRSSVLYSTEELERYKARKTNPAYAFGDTLKPIDLAANKLAFEKRLAKRKLATVRQSVAAL